MKVSELHVENQTKNEGHLPLSLVYRSKHNFENYIWILGGFAVNTNIQVQGHEVQNGGRVGDVLVVSNSLEQHIRNVLLVALIFA